MQNRWFFEFLIDFYSDFSIFPSELEGYPL